MTPSKLNSLLAKYGKPMTFTSVTKGEYNPETGEIDNNEIEYDVIGLIKDYSASEYKENLILAGDRKITLSASDIEPKATDYVTIDNENWQVVSVSCVFQKQSQFLYFLQVRK